MHGRANQASCAAFAFCRFLLESGHITLEESANAAPRTTESSTRLMGGGRMAQVARSRSGRGVSLWVALVGAAVSCAVGAGAHALVTEGGVEVVRSVIVHVDGSVASPGVYELPGEDVRVGDVVDAAGGLSEGADLSSVNLAARVLDGEKVHIPAEGEETSPVITGSVNPVASSQDPVVNINTATVEELTVLPGIGEATAAAIVEDRERMGPFASPEDIMRVSGIGERKYERIKDQIRVA